MGIDPMSIDRRWLNLWRSWGCGPHWAFARNKSKLNTKKPTAASLSNCGDGVSKMIHCDSFRRNSERRGRPSGDYGGIATKWNRLESPEAFSVRSWMRAPRDNSCNMIRRHAARVRGVGGYKSLRPLGARYRMGLTRRFFIAPGLLNYFPEIKEFKRPFVPARDRSRVSSSGCLATSWLFRVAGSDFRRIIFQAPRGRRSLKKAPRNSGWGGWS
jgi:hypothetical protein